MSRRDTIAALLAEHGDVVVGQGVTVRAGVRENVRRCVCGLALPWPREEANRAHRAHVADVIDRALDQDEPRQDQGGDREALAARRDTLIEAISWLEDLAAEVSDD